MIARIVNQLNERSKTNSLLFILWMIAMTAMLANVLIPKGANATDCATESNTYAAINYDTEMLIDQSCHGFEIMGDGNGDGLVNASDASLALNIYSDNSTGSKAEYNPMLDVNADGKIDASDASNILIVYANFSTWDPGENYSAICINYGEDLVVYSNANDAEKGENAIDVIKKFEPYAVYYENRTVLSVPDKHGNARYIRPTPESYVLVDNGPTTWLTDELFMENEKLEVQPVLEGFDPVILGPGTRFFRTSVRNGEGSDIHVFGKIGTYVLPEDKSYKSFVMKTKVPQDFPKGIYDSNENQSAPTTTVVTAEKTDTKMTTTVVTAEKTDTKMTTTLATTVNVSPSVVAYWQYVGESEFVAYKVRTSRYSPIIGEIQVGEMFEVIGIDGDEINVRKWNKKNSELEDKYGKMSKGNIYMYVDAYDNSWEYFKPVSYDVYQRWLNDQRDFTITTTSNNNKTTNASTTTMNTTTTTTCTTTPITTTTTTASEVPKPLTTIPKPEKYTTKEYLEVECPIYADMVETSFVRNMEVGTGLYLEQLNIDGWFRVTTVFGEHGYTKKGYGYRSFVADDRIYLMLGPLGDPPLVHKGLFKINGSWFVWDEIIKDLQDAEDKGITPKGVVSSSDEFYILYYTEEYYRIVNSTRTIDGYLSRTDELDSILEQIAPEKPWEEYEKEILSKVNRE